MNLNKDKTLASLHIQGDLTAQDMDVLISKLGEMRSDMHPSVAETRAKALTANAPATVENSPAMMTARLTDGRIRFWARSAGFGWMAFNVTESDAMSIRDFLIANLPSAASDLFGHQDTHRH